MSHFSIGSVTSQTSVFFKHSFFHPKVANLALKHSIMPEAEEQFKKVIELDSTNRKARHFYGLALIAKKQFPEAEEQVKKITELEPTDSKAWFYYGTSLKQQKKLDEAKKAYQQVSKIDPTNDQLCKQAAAEITAMQ